MGAEEIKTKISKKQNRLGSDSLELRKKVRKQLEILHLRLKIEELKEKITRIRKS